MECDLNVSILVQFSVFFPRTLGIILIFCGSSFFTAFH